ncbi:MAG: hypothetical protein HRU06_05985 [Oceanospirillaceae bacterium]|nr:hypothetical protein [Oceanospirillaceae bacterium]
MQELIKVFNSETNPLIIVVLILYYVLINWSKLKDGLGLSKDNRTNLAKIEQNYNLLKLRIEIEQLKKNSGLDNDLLLTLDQEMNDRLDNITNKAYTPSQKFIAIPLAFLFTITAFLELQSTAAEIDALETLLGLVLMLVLIYIGFWGLPILQKQRQGLLKSIGFIIFWSVAFYILACTFLFTVSEMINDSELFMEYLGVIFIISTICSITLGVFGKLPMSRQVISK